MIPHFLKRLFGRDRRQADFSQAFGNFRQLLARYDAAATTDENRKHWSAADGRSARAANDPATRQTLRMRSRYEVANNSYASGIVRTLANHTIGFSPRLQILTDDEAVNDRVERAWNRWSKKVQLHQKLLVTKQTQVRDGEVFGLMTRNRNIGPIELDLKLIEADQATQPWRDVANPYIEDGIRIDEDGNPVEYYFLDHHPGDTAFVPTLEGEWYQAKDVLHYFRCERPGQLRGIPDLMPALPLFAMLRRFTLATVSAAEIAAMFAAFLKTTAAGVEPAGSPADFASLEIERGMLTTLPEGWDINQLSPEHPATTYDMFTRGILSEIARCLSMPYNIAAGSSAGYNYSSGRLDHQIYYRGIEIDQAQIESAILDRLFAAWLDEATYVPGLLDGVPPFEELDYYWQWDGQPVIDERVDAMAAMTRLSAGLSTMPQEYARSGRDWRKAQISGAKSLGMTVDEFRQRVADSILGPPAPAPDSATGTGGNAGVEEVEAAAAGGEYSEISRQQWNRNRKAILDVLNEAQMEEISRVMAKEMLLSLGLTEGRADTLLDDVLGPAVEETEEEEAHAV